MHRLPILVPLVLLAAACSGPGRSAEERVFERQAPAGDPRQAEVPLATVSADWNASLVVDNDPTGIWTVAVLQAFPQYASPEIVGLDDLGRCHVMVSYSGKWTPITTVADGTWLGGLAHGDVDPRVAGNELYVGSQKGNVYQVVTYRDGAIDHRRVAHLGGREIHTIVVADAIPWREGLELLVFTRPGGLYLLSPREDGDGFAVESLGELDGRVRDALVLPSTREGLGDEIVTAARTGQVSILQWTPAGPGWTTVHELPMGRGRLTIRPRGSPDEALVIYSTADDGSIWRHERPEPDVWNSEPIFLGPQGPRGLVAGRFHEDPSVESVALFGYSKRVQLLSRSPGGEWSVETLFVDRDKGHWLAAGELDGRNATDEIVASGYGARIVLLARPPGYGLEVLADPEAEGER